MKRRKRRIAPAGAILLCGMFIGSIWLVDGVVRMVREPDENAVVWEDALDTDTVLLEAEDTPTDDSTAPVDGSTPLQIQDAYTSLTSPAQDLPEGYTTIPQDESDIHSGMLVQVDSAHPHTCDAGELATFEGKNESYRMKRMDLSIKAEVVTAMNSMGSAYVNDNGAVNLMIYSTVAPYDVAGSLYPEQLPDRSTGYCIDLCLLNADETISKLTEPNAWVQSYGWKYGFVQSYPAKDAALTGVEETPYHLRYVGPVHAGIMHEQGLTLTGYYDYLRSHTVSVPLYYTVGETMYTVYYVPAGAGTTEVPVPMNKDYEISGNNTDGFIVTVKG